MKRRAWMTLVPHWPTYRLKPVSVWFGTRAEAEELARHEWRDDWQVVPCIVEWPVGRQSLRSEGRP